MREMCPSVLLRFLLGFGINYCTTLFGSGVGGCSADAAGRRPGLDGPSELHELITTTEDGFDCQCLPYPSHLN